MRRLLLRVVAVFLIICSIPALLYPVAMLFMSPGPMLLRDTRSLLGAGTADGVPTVSQVNCSAEEFGAGYRLRRFRLWNCLLMLSAPESQPAAAVAGDPYAGMSRDEAMEEYQRQISQLSAATRQAPSVPSYLERQLPQDRSGDLPRLRQLSAAGEPPEYGVIWGGRELSIRWLFWGLLTVVMLIFGGGCLYAAKVAWRRSKAVHV